MAELESIVASMEGGELSLADSLSAYKRGAELLHYCQPMLKRCEQQVQVLERGVLQAFTPDALARTARHAMKPEIACRAGRGSAWSGSRAALEQALPPTSEVPAMLHAAMRYAALGGGKRVAPACSPTPRASWCAEPTGSRRAAAARRADPRLFARARRLPCMDDDVLRRGKPTVHVEYDEATALLVGDALQSLAFELLTDGGAPECRRSGWSSCCAACRAARAAWPAGRRSTWRASGKPLSLPELERCIASRPARLLAAAVLLGAAAARRSARSELDALERYATRRRPRVPGGRRLLDVDRTAPRPSARPPARTRSRTSRPTCRCSASSRRKALAAQLRSEAHARARAVRRARTAPARARRP